MRMKLLLSMTLLALLVLSIDATNLCEDLLVSAADDPIYNQMVTISGKVTILNHPELGVTPFNGAYLVFQRADCKRCLVATFADAKGNYKIIVGLGKYKIIMENPSPPTYDMLAPDQPRYVTATSVIEETDFSIKVMLSKD